nr:hypothetical protein [Polymorphobacter sp.]
MRAITSLRGGGGIALAAALAVAGCGKIKPTEAADPAKIRAAAHRQQAACSSAEAYDRLKGVMFDQATAAQPAARAKLDTLADYSFVRMTNPVVAGSDPALQITRCHGCMVLELPSAAGPAFGGEHSLQADVDYTAQAAADGHGLVYQLKGAEPIVTRLAAFNLGGGAYRPPPAIDEQQAAPGAPPPMTVADARPPDGPGAPDPLAPAARGAPQGPSDPAVREAVPVIRHRLPPQPTPDRVVVKAEAPLPRDDAYRKSRRDNRAGGGGEETVRTFYNALGTGDGETASAQVVPEKRGGRVYSPGAISRFYGRLPEPLRLRDIVPLAGGSYRVTYRYSTGRSHCDGTSIVNLTSRGGGPLIRSIRALSDC